MNVPKDYRPLVSAAHQAGWTTKRTGKGHVALIDPAGVTVTTLPSTSGNRHRLRLNITSLLRRHGLEV